MKEAAAFQHGKTKVALRDYIENRIDINDPGPPDESGLVPCPVCKTKLDPRRMDQILVALLAHPSLAPAAIDDEKQGRQRAA